MTTTVTVTVPRLLACRDGDVWWALARDPSTHLSAVGRGHSRCFAFSEALFNLGVELEVRESAPSAAPRYRFISSFDRGELDVAERTLTLHATASIVVWAGAGAGRSHGGQPRLDLIKRSRDRLAAGAQAVGFAGGDGGRAVCGYAASVDDAVALVLERLTDLGGTDESVARDLLGELGVEAETFSLADGVLKLKRAHGGFSQTFSLSRWNPRALRRAIEQELERRRALQ